MPEQTTPWTRRANIPVVNSKPAPGQQQLTPKSAAETVQGAGLDEILSKTEGRARLKAVATTVAAEAWAGQLAEPTELQHDSRLKAGAIETVLAIARSNFGRQ